MCVKRVPNLRTEFTHKLSVMVLNAGNHNPNYFLLFMFGFR